jgi:lipoate-protein ligase A
MLLIDNKNSSDPTINLALEEHCYRNLDAFHDYILFYINKPSIIVGNHQNPFQEFDCEFAGQKQIRPLRRISGGGTVYHDFGNLNFSFITAFTEEKLDYFKTLIQPILNTLQHLGVTPELTEKNTILIKGQKISGNSQHTNMSRMLSHGTLLFNSDLDVLNRVLNPNLEVVKSRGVPSRKSDVTNITEFLPHPMRMKDFVAKLKAAVSDAFGVLKEYQLTGEEWKAVHRLAEEKYRSWDWTFGRSPEFIARHRIKLAARDVEVLVSVKNGLIKDIRMAENHAADATIFINLAGFVGTRYGSESANQLLK